MKTKKFNFLSLSLLLMVGLFALQLEAKKPCCKPNTACAANLKVSSPSLVSAACNKVTVTCDCEPYAKDPNTCVTPPTDFGPYGVGYVEILLHDNVTPTTGTSPIPLLTSIWFPVSKAAANSLPVTSYRISPSPTDSTYIPVPSSFYTELAQAASVSFPATIAVDGTNLKPIKTKSPLILFATGDVSTSWVVANQLERLASHGFISVSPNPTGNSLQDIMFGTAAPGAGTNAIDPLLISELQVTLNLILQLNQTPGNKFFNAINPSKILGMGVSRGVWVTMGLAAIDSRIKGLIEEGGIADDIALPLITVPFIELGGSADIFNALINNGVDPSYAGILNLYPQIATPSCLKYWMNILGAGHASAINPCQQVAYFNALVNAITPATLPSLIAGHLATFYQVQGCAVPIDPLYPITPDEVQAISMNYIVSFAQVFGAGNSSYLPFLTEKYFLSNHLPLQYHNGCSTTSSCLIGIDRFNELHQGCATPNSPTCCQVAPPPVLSRTADNDAQYQEKIEQLLARITDPVQKERMREALNKIKLFLV